MLGFTLHLSLLSRSTITDIIRSNSHRLGAMSIEPAADHRGTFFIFANLIIWAIVIMSSNCNLGTSSNRSSRRRYFDSSAASTESASDEFRYDGDGPAEEQNTNDPPQLYLIDEDDIIPMGLYEVHKSSAYDHVCDSSAMTSEPSSPQLNRLQSPKLHTSTADSSAAPMNEAVTDANDKEQNNHHITNAQPSQHFPSNIVSHCPLQHQDVCKLRERITVSSDHHLDEEDGLENQPMATNERMGKFIQDTYSRIRRESKLDRLNELAGI